MDIALLRGGVESEHDISLQSGAHVYDALRERHNVKDIIIQPDLAWTVREQRLHPTRALQQCEVAFIALHGPYGEDGQVQKHLEAMGVPYTGADAVSSALGMHKKHAKAALEKHDLKTPRSAVVRSNEEIRSRADEIYRTLPMPWVVKPMNAGSSVGITIAESHEELVTGIESALEYSSSALVEEHVKGREVSCVVIERFRGEELYTPPPIEIRPAADRAFFDYQAKYAGQSDEICPGNFSPAERDLIQDAARRVHRVLGARHYSRTDMILSPNRGLFTLEINTLPGLTKSSLVPQAIEAVGSTMEEFLDHIISLSIKRSSP